MENNNEFVGFAYRLSFDDPNVKPQATFQEVSGISVTMDKSQVEGGSNRFTHQVPGRTTFENLVLKRGLISKGAPLFNWCHETLNGALSSEIETKNIIISLLDANTAVPLMKWNFFNAYPVKWAILGADNLENEVAVETLEFAYSYFDSA